MSLNISTVKPFPEIDAIELLQMKEGLVASYDNLISCGMHLDEAHQVLDELIVSLDFLSKNPTKQAVETLNSDGSLERLFNVTGDLITVTRAQEGFFGAIGDALKTFLKWVLQAIDYIVKLIGVIVKTIFNLFRVIHEGLIWCISALSNNVTDEQFVKAAKSTSTVPNNGTATEGLSIAIYFERTRVLGVQEHNKVDEFFNKFRNSKLADIVENFPLVEKALHEVSRADEATIKSLTENGGPLAKLAEQCPDGRDGASALADRLDREFAELLEPYKASIEKKMTFYDRGYTSRSVAIDILKRSGTFISNVEKDIDAVKTTQKKIEELERWLNTILSPIGTDPDDPMLPERKRVIHQSVGYLMTITRGYYRLLRIIYGFYSCQCRGLKWFIDKAAKEPK